MADRGFGLVMDDLRKLACDIASQAGRDHPFHNGFAGRGWMEGFRKRHPKLTLRTPQALSYCRAAMVNKDAVDDFFAKLGALYGRLNLISKPMQIFNIDETGISVVHKPGRVVCELGRKHVYSLTSGEKGQTHTVVSCVSVSGVVLPPMLIYPRKRAVPEGFRTGALPGTVFTTSDNGWITQEIYIEWFKLFLQSIPPARPVLLLEDGHASHITIEVIELARKNNVHLLCLPAHTSHILQPLDVGVFKSFKTNYSKACRRYMVDHPGRVITSDAIAGLLAEAWPLSFTPVNILSGFKKTGVYPLNPGEVCDRMLAPSKSVNKQKAPPRTEEQVALYQRRYEEGYDLFDADYSDWLRQTYPETSPKSDAGDSLKTHLSSSDSRSVTSDSRSATSQPLSDILVFPEPKPQASRRKRKPAINAKAVCLSDLDTLQTLKDKENEKLEVEKEKIKKKQSLEEKRKQKLKEKEEKAAAREQKKKQRLRKKDIEKKSTSKSLLSQMKNLELSDKDSEEDIECPKCHQNVECRWICCDSCDVWYHIQCTSVSPDNIPDIFYCENCP